MFAFQLTGWIATSPICAWGKAGTLHRGKYRCLKQIEQVMKVLEHDEKGSFGKEMQLMKCILASDELVTLKVQFLL